MKRYLDKYGVIWLRISLNNVAREDNGCIGGWFNGDGLVEV